MPGFAATTFHGCAAAALPPLPDRDRPTHPGAAAGSRGRASDFAECDASHRMADGAWSGTAAGAQGVA